MSVVQEFIGPHQSLDRLLVYWPVFVCALVGGLGRDRAQSSYCPFV